MGISFGKPHAASKAEIDALVEGFAHAAEYLEKAGFDGIQLHGAHGYIISQFLSRRTNKRTDEYGGSFENRIRLLLEIMEAVQSVWPETLPLFVRISATDWVEGG